MKILLTRTDEQNKRSADRLKALGYEPVCLALGEVLDTGIAINELSNDGVIITSANAVKVLAKRNVSISSPIFVVGERTKQAVEKTSLGAVKHVAPNAKSLAEYLQSTQLDTQFDTRFDVKFSYLAGEEIAFDFNTYFRSDAGQRHVLVDVQEVYKIIRIEPSRTVLNDSVLACENGFQLHYSAASAAHFFEIITKNDLENISKTMRAVAISNKTSQSVDFSLVKSVQNAKIETEASMFEVIQNTPQT